MLIFNTYNTLNLKEKIYWLTSVFLQLANGFMQLAAAGRWRNILCFTVFLKLNDTSHVITIFKIFICGGTSSYIRSKILVLRQCAIW